MTATAKDRDAITMTDWLSPERAGGRRSFLVATIVSVYATIGTAIAMVLGRTILAPSRLRKEEVVWLPAAAVSAVREKEPVAVTVRLVRQDGFARVVDRVIVYLVRGVGHEVRALRSECTHLGCRTHYDRDTGQILCPCHGGVYDVQGNVVDGPPPSPLPELATRIENGRVFVQI